MLEPGDRLGVVGPNGAGKSTLLDLIAGRLQPTQGRVEIGRTVKIGYYDQLGRDLDLTQRVRDAVAGDKGEPTLDDVKLMRQFWFDGDAQFAPIGTLSGGERRRLQLLLTLIEQPNLLLLDEPTNDLDLDTLRALEEFLDDWPGILVVVSHDRVFLDRTVSEVHGARRQRSSRRWCAAASPDGSRNTRRGRPAPRVRRVRRRPPAARRQRRHARRRGPCRRRAPAPCAISWGSPIASSPMRSRRATRCRPSSSRRAATTRSWRASARSWPTSQQPRRRRRGALAVAGRRSRIAPHGHLSPTRGPAREVSPDAPSTARLDDRRVGYSPAPAGCNDVSANAVYAVGVEEAGRSVTTGNSAERAGVRGVDERFARRRAHGRAAVRRPRRPFTPRAARSRCTSPGSRANAVMALVSPGGKTLTTQHADSLGGLLFRNVAPGAGYRVRLVSNGQESGAITVHGDAAAPWDPNVYNQTIPDNGYTYLTTRDGTKLAIDVHPPTSPAGEPGLPAGTSLPNGPDFLPPYPTLIEYSGYGYADPAGPVNGIAVLANLMGFAVVDVNMRGTGCSGGAFDFFEPLQNLDGYDVIQTIAHQPWVKDHKVGMMGISYGAISQLFTAQFEPARARGHLAAVDPRRHRDDALSGWRAQHGLRGRLGATAPGGSRTGRTPQRAALGVPADPKWRHDVQGQSGAPRRGRQPELEDRRQLTLRRGCRRPPRPRQLREQDQGAGLHGVPVGRRADGRALPRARAPLHRHDSEVVHVHQRRAHRLDRPRHLQPLVRLLGIVRRAPGADRERRGHPGGRARRLPNRDGPPEDRPGHDAGRPRPADPDLQRGADRVREASGGAGAVRQRRRRVAHRHAARRRSVRRVRAELLDVPDGRYDRAHLVLRAERRTRRDAARRERGQRRSPPTRTRCRSPTTRAPTLQPAGCGATRRNGSGTGSRTPRAPRCRTSRRDSRRTPRSSAPAL